MIGRWFVCDDGNDEIFEDLQLVDGTDLFWGSDDDFLLAETCSICENLNQCPPKSPRSSTPLFIDTFLVKTEGVTAVFLSSANFRALAENIMLLL